MNGKPEWLQSSVRPIITYALVAAVLIGFLAMGKIEGPQVLLLATSAISFWFGERAALKQPTIRCPFGCPTCNGATMPPAAPPGPQASVNFNWRG